MFAAVTRPPPWTELLGQRFPIPVPLGKLIGFASAHTGLPVILVCAIALVLSWKIAKRTLRFAVEVGLVLGLLSVASYFGWVRL